MENQEVTDPEIDDDQTEPEFDCSSCRRRLPFQDRYGGPADNGPDVPEVCSNCIERAFAESG